MGRVMDFYQLGVHEMWGNIAGGSLLLVICFGFGWLMTIAIEESNKTHEERQAIYNQKHAEFFTECLNDGKKNYECEVLWGQARQRRR